METPLYKGSLEIYDEKEIQKYIDQYCVLKRNFKEQAIWDTYT